MSTATIVFIVGFILFLAFLVYYAITSNNPREAMISRVKLYHNIKTGYKCKIETDYNDSENYIKHDPNNPQQGFINRESKGILDRGERRINLSNNILERKYEGYTQLFDNVDDINKQLILKIDRLESEKKELTNWVSSVVPEIKHLRNKRDVNVNEIVDLLRKMNDSMPKIFIKGGKQQGNQGAR